MLRGMTCCSREQRAVDFGMRRCVDSSETDGCRELTRGSIFVLDGVNDARKADKEDQKGQSKSQNQLH
jgi:hypothetical protein